MHSGHADLAAALSENWHDNYYITPLRLKEYISHNLGLLNYHANLDRLNYRPYLRFKRRFRQYEQNRIMKILNEYGLLNKETFIISDGMEHCHDLKKIVPPNVRVVYYIKDRYSEYDKRTEAEKADFDQRENEIIKECDIVLCVSQKLLSEAQLLNKQSFWFPNAVSEEQIIKARNSSSTGKIGMISNNLSRIDWPLLCNIAQQLGEFTIELIGENDLPLGFEFPKNIHIVGRIPFRRLKEYVNQWDAGLALYQKTRFNEYCCPLKYFEYSSFDIPTVATTIPEGKIWAELYPEAIYLADDVGHVSEYIRRIFEQNRALDYTRMARENTWGIRAEQLCTLFENFRGS